MRISWLNPFRKFNAASPLDAARASATRNPRVLCALIVVSVMILLLGGGCDHIFPFQAAQIKAYQCPAKVEVATPLALQCDNYITVTGGHHSLTPQFDVFSNNNPAPGKYPKLYLDADYVPTADGIPGAVKGTCLVRLSAKDNTSPVPDYLRLSFNVPPETIYIAFDRRAKTPPPWLDLLFKPVVGVFLKSTEKPKTASGSPNVQYQLYEPKNPSNFAKGASFGGNNLGTVWTGGDVGAQYLVFIKKTQSSATNPDIYQITIEVCTTEAGSSDSAYQKARDHETEILKDWVTKQNLVDTSAPMKLAFQSQDCQPVYDPIPVFDNIYKTCGKADALTSSLQSKTYNLVINAWPRMSTAFIDSAQSTATIQALDTSQTVPVGGPISFRINENNDLTIDEITLFVAPFSVKDVKIEKISIGQRGSVLALCADKLVPKPYGLCNNYSIPATDNAFAGLGATVNGDPVFTPLVNKGPIPIAVDFNNRIFKLSGANINGKVPKQDGSNIDVLLSLDITGKFENFAPVASTKEMKKKFECKDNNRAFVTFDGRASYDLDQSKATLLYKWVEDARTPAQRVLGNKDNFTLPMTFGGHKITLSVEDNRNAISSVTFDIEVFDSKIDHYMPPADVYAVLTAPGTPIALGNATASDDCSGHVQISNNAPAKMLFPEGFTPVDWTFDDYRGNLVIHRQNVFNVPLKWYPPPIAIGHASFQSMPGQGTGQSLTYFYETKAQGKAMEADEYILLETPKGDVYSFDGQNRLQRPNEIVRHGPTTKFGVADTKAVLLVDRWDQRFPEIGMYVFKHILVRPNGDPKNNTTVIAYHQFDFHQGPPPAE